MAHNRRHAMVIDILFVIPPDALLLDIAGPAEAFRLANLHRARRGENERFRLRFAGPEPRVTTSVGMPIVELEPLPQALRSPTWTIVVGQPAAVAARATPAIEEIERWLGRVLHKALARATRRTGSSRSARARSSPRARGCCATSSARRTTSCSRRCMRMRPRRRWSTTASISSTGPSLRARASPRASTWRSTSSAGMRRGAGGQRRARHGGVPAAIAARRGALALPREPAAPASVVHRVQDAMAADARRDWDMPSLAALANVSERHLLRLFREHAGVTPLEMLESIRLERARKSLERGQTVTRAADDAGFSSGLQLRAHGRSSGVRSAGIR
jgi:transcriptional regulator GlxA family with amidase domain